MLDAVGGRSRWPLVAAVLVGLAALGVGSVPEVADRASVLVAGGSPLASPFAEVRRDHPYPESPLAVSLALEAGLADVEAERALAFADELARDLGWWLLATAGASDLDEAERTLWATDHEPDRFAVAWAARAQEREVHARTSVPGLWSGPPEQGPVYVHPDELPLLLAHVAWRLDLRAELVRSPIHLYLLLREPGGDGVRGVEPTCFRRVDAFGKSVPHDDPSVGRRLTFGEDFFSSGVGGIRNPDPLPPGAYTTVQPGELTGELLARAAKRHDVDVAALEARLAEQPSRAVAELVWMKRLADGLAAVEGDDPGRASSALMRLADLRARWPGLVPAMRDERVLEAYGRLSLGDARGLEIVRAVLKDYEPDGPVLFAKSDAHAVAMALELEHGRPSAVDWNARVIPLMNRHRSDPARFAELCAIGRRVLADTRDDLDVLIPECRAH